jgi:hypothetical protein
MTQNTTDNVASPTFTLSSRDNITLAMGTTADIQVDAMNPVVTILSASAGTLFALTGLVVGGNIQMYVYDPSGNTLYANTVKAGYFAIPLLASTSGNYPLYITSTSSSYVELTPTAVSATSMSIGQFSSGEISIPSTITKDTNLTKADQIPQILAISYSVSKGDEYAFSFTADDILTSAPFSQYSCYIFDVNTNMFGVPWEYLLASTGSGTPQPVVSEALVSGSVYMVLVSQYISKFQYSMGVESAVIPTAPLNTPFLLSLPTPFGMNTQLYEFTISADSIARINYTSPAGTIAPSISKLMPNGTVYTAGGASLGGTTYFQPGAAESNLQYMLYLSKGDYMLSFYSSGTASANMEIDTYPIVNYTSGTSFNMGVHTTQAFAINVSKAFEYQSLNVTLLSQLNASITYQVTVFDVFNRYLNSYVADGSSGSHPGIGNKEINGAWLGDRTTTNTTDPLVGAPPRNPTTRYFSGNESLQEAQFVPTYAGKYFLILDLTNGFNSTTAGINNATRWRFYPNLTVQLEINLSNPNPENIGPGVLDITYLTLDSSSGTGTTSVTLTSPAAGAVSVTRMIGLILTPEVNTWTRITVTITNGTVGTTTNKTARNPIYYERVFDELRYNGTNTFDPDNGLSPKVWQANTYHMVQGTSAPYSVTYIIEFGAFQRQMMIQFLTLGYLNTTAHHTVVSINVSHFSTRVVSGLSPLAGPAPPGPAAPFPVTIVLVIVVVVVVALVVIFLVVRRRSRSRV